MRYLNTGRPIPLVGESKPRLKTRAHPVIITQLQRDCRSKLQRLRSCGCLPLEVGNRCSSRLGRARFTRLLADDELDPWERRSSSRSSVTGLRGLRRRTMAERSKASGSAAAARTRVPYDPHTYAQNFDEGSSVGRAGELVSVLLGEVCRSVNDVAGAELISDHLETIFDPTEHELGNCNVARVDPTEHELGNCDVARVDLTEQELGNCGVARVDPTEQELGNRDVARVDPTEQELGNCDVGLLPRVNPGASELGHKFGDLAERVNSGTNPEVAMTSSDSSTSVRVVSPSGSGETSRSDPEVGSSGASSEPPTPVDARVQRDLEVMMSDHDLDTAVTEGSLAVIRERYSIPTEYGLHVPEPGQRPYSLDVPGMCISVDALEAGLRFPLHPLIEECLKW
ncbi:hypothetical protein GW17_00047134 [Ensete ventricosum]|nr:hypothetical protein GW17_00047134 [Ensete ventricosum]